MRSPRPQGQGRDPQDRQPGGTTAGSEAVYEAVRKISKDKPVVAVMDTVAASGGYITALAADRIVARGNTITGSIGVIFSFPKSRGSSIWWA